jgi:hypothetical protein
MDEQDAPPLGQGGPKWLQGPRRVPPDPPGYRRVAYDRIPMNRVTLLGLISAPIWLGLFLFVSGVLGGPREISFHISFMDVLIALVLLLVVVPVVHEAVHGIVAQLTGAHPSYGVGPGYAYTTFLEPVGKGEYLLIGLAPLVVLSVIGLAVLVLVPSITGLTLVFLVGNAAGAVGDIWMAWRTRLLPAGVRIYDLADGFVAYLPEREDQPA